MHYKMTGEPAEANEEADYKSGVQQTAMEKQPWFAPEYYEDITIVEKMTDGQVERLSRNEFMVLMGTCRRKITNAERLCWDEIERVSRLQLAGEGI